MMNCLRIFHLCHFLVIFLVVINECDGDYSNSLWEESYTPPLFENQTERDVTVTIGKTALLICRVKNLGDRAVSWIRKRDLHILSIGILTYTNDQRFQVVHSEGSNEWSLRITSPQPRDSGTYECQVSTEPKMSQSFRLNVIVPKAKIHSNREIYIKSGNDINLTCSTGEFTAPPSFIYWYKGSKVINYSQRGGINVSTDRSTKTSNLIIKHASHPADSGNYTCSPSNSDSDSVTVHVISNIDVAAMKYGNGSMLLSCGNSFRQKMLFSSYVYLLLLVVVFPLYLR